MTQWCECDSPIYTYNIQNPWKNKHFLVALHTFTPCMAMIDTKDTLSVEKMLSTKRRKNKHKRNIIIDLALGALLFVAILRFGFLCQMQVGRVVGCTGPSTRLPSNGQCQREGRQKER